MDVGDFAKAIAHYQARQREAEQTSLMFKTLAEAMAPFRATEFCTYLMDDLDFLSRKIVVEIKNLPDIKLQISWSRDEELDALDSPLHFFWKMGYELGKQFQAIPRVEPDPHIELGEN